MIRSRAARDLGAARARLVAAALLRCAGAFPDGSALRLDQHGVMACCASVSADVRALQGPAPRCARSSADEWLGGSPQPSPGAQRAGRSAASSKLNVSRLSAGHLTCSRFADDAWRTTGAKVSRPTRAARRFRIKRLAPLWRWSARQALALQGQRPARGTPSRRRCCQISRAGGQAVAKGESESCVPRLHGSRLGSCCSGACRAPTGTPVILETMARSPGVLL